MAPILRSRPLDERKAKLAALIAPLATGILLSEHIDADGATVFRHACRLGCEGIVSKRRDAPYLSGRTKTWFFAWQRVDGTLLYPKNLLTRA